MSRRSHVLSLFVALALSVPAMAKGPKVKVADDPMVGEADAELVLLEFANFA